MVATATRRSAASVTAHVTRPNAEGNKLLLNGTQPCNAAWGGGGGGGRGGGLVISEGSISGVSSASTCCSVCDCAYVYCSLSGSGMSR